MPQKPRNQSNTSSARRELAAALLALLALLVVIVGMIATAGGAAPTPTAPPQSFTLDPRIIVNLTELPQATPLSGAAATTWEMLRKIVRECDDYSPQRLSQMEQHIDWLLNPSTIPADIILALGPNPTGKLIFGMATYTASEWRLGGRQPDSCLPAIGWLLNEMLVEAGEEPFSVYDEGSDS